MYANPEDFKASNGVQLTQALFYEFNNRKAPYTLKTQDYKQYKSVYQIYMNSVDEYDACMKIVGSLDHWRKLCALDWFMEGKVVGTGENTYRLSGLRQWREDMKQRDASLAKRQLLEQAENGSVPAQRLLFESSKPKAVKPKEEIKTNSTVSDLSKRFKGLNGN